MKKLIAITIILATALSLFSCQKTDPKPQSRAFFEYFDTVGTFYDYSGLNDKEFAALADRVEAELLEYHRLYDIYNEYNGTVNIKTINDNAGNGAIKVDKKIINLLLFSKEMYVFTNGMVNIAMGSVLKLWHDKREEAKITPESASLPDMSELKKAGEHCNIDDLIIDEINSTVELRDPEMRLDVGAIAKGYAVEMICAGLIEDGYRGMVLDVGGNLRAVGTKPSGKGWETGIKNPVLNSDNPYIYRFELKNASTVTSGSYERYYTVDGKKYHHIINGETLMPENHYISVSIITSSSALADALSTAIFNMEYDEAKAFVESKKGLTVVLMLSDKTVKILEGIPHK